MQLRLPSSIYLWGYGCGSCFRYDQRNRHEPTLLDNCPDDNPEWTQIACGKYFTAALTKEGEVYTWGENEYGQLGHGDEKSRRVPTKVAGLDGFIIIKVECGEFHTAALTDKGEIFTWGRHWDYLRGPIYKDYKELTPKKVEALAGEVIVEVTCGCYHTCAVTSTGSIYTWGHYYTGIGHGEVIGYPRLLVDLSTKNVVCMSSNCYFTACVTRDGEVYTWGRGSYGELGHGDREDQYTPKRVEALIGVKATQVACGLDHTAVCTDDGEVFTFGNGKYGQLGHGDKEEKTSPALVKALQGKHITQVQCGESHTMALTSSGYVFTCGYAEFGRLGHGKSKLNRLSVPCLVEGLLDHNVVQIRSRYNHCAVVVDPSPSAIRQSQHTSFNNKDNSDVVFMVESEPVYANVDVISQKCDYFAAMFIRSNMRESIERVVEIPNCSKAAFVQVLEFLCLDGFVVSLDYILEVWSLADMYQLEGLKFYCLGALERGLFSRENESQILKEAENLSCPCDKLNKMFRGYLLKRRKTYERNNAYSLLSNK